MGSYSGTGDGHFLSSCKGICGYVLVNTLTSYPQGSKTGIRTKSGFTWI